MKKYPLFPFLLLVCSVALSFAASPDSSLLTLERIFSSPEFRPEFFGQVRWLADGSGYTRLEQSRDSLRTSEIVRYHPLSGAKTVLVSAKDLTPPDADRPLDIEDYHWSDDGARLLIFTNTRRVWRSNTRGDYWVLDLKTKSLQKLGGDAPGSSLMFAKFSPDNGRVAYVQQNDIYVQDLADNAITRLTDTGSKTLINGTFDWVYEEELFLRDGFRWSPDGKRIAFWQLDASGVGEFYMINNTDSIYSKIIPVQYPKAGTTNSACRVGVVAAGGRITWLDVPGDPRNNYIARMDWANNSSDIILQHLNRLQNVNHVMLGDAATGAVRTILTEQDSAWVDIVNEPTWLKKRDQFLWLSERDGWRHLYRVSRDGEIRLLTPDAYDILAIEAVDEAKDWVYLTASPENAAQRYLYRVPLSGNGKLERITPADQPGSHSYNISPDAKYAVHTCSSFGVPSQTELVRLPGHQRIRALAENDRLREKVAALQHSPVEFLKITIQDTLSLDAWLMRPPDFDPAKRYPLLFHIYGEPAGQTVLDRWGGSGYLWHLMLTQQGYLVMSVDNSGTPAPKGREWRKCVYRKVGVLASEDQAAVAQQVRKWPFVDSTRIGIWGWSGGGSMTLNMLFRYPLLYQTGMSVAPVGDQRYYDTIYQERYMGLPQDNSEDYRNGSPVTFAHQLQGNLLIVHGTGDDNVHYQNTEVVINALIAANKPFTMMAYPNRSHGIYEGRNTTRHLYELLTRYLRENLPPGGR